MPEYIDREKLYTEVTEKYHDITAGSYPFNVVAHDMAKLVKNAPAEDVVPVVRCKDCKHYELMKSNNYHFCNKYGGYVTENDYCSRCERKADNG